MAAEPVDVTLEELAKLTSDDMRLLALAAAHDDHEDDDERFPAHLPYDDVLDPFRHADL